MIFGSKFDPLSGLRQLFYPKEFRIPAAVWPAELVATVERLARLSSLANAVGLPSPVEDPAAENARMRFLAELGTGLWRLRQKMIEPGSDRPREDVRRAYRHFESVWDTLAEAGVEVQDHTNARFDSGMDLKVIAFQPTPGAEQRRVLDTIKPSVYYKKRMIQMGEVIVATPEQPSGGTSGSGSASA